MLTLYQFALKGRSQPKAVLDVWRGMHWTIDRVGGKRPFAALCANVCYAGLSRHCCLGMLLTQHLLAVAAFWYHHAISVAKLTIRDKTTSSIFTFVVVRLDRRRAGRVAFSVSVVADATHMGSLYDESGSQSVPAKSILADLKSFRTAYSPPRAAGSSGSPARSGRRTSGSFWRGRLPKASGIPSPSRPRPIHQ